MITSFEVWLAIAVGNLPPIFIVLALICLLFFFFFGSMCCEGKKTDGDGKKIELSTEEKAEIKGFLKMFGWACLLFCILTLITPNKKEMAAIYLIPKIANNEVTQKLPSYVEPFLRKMLDMEDPKTGK